MSSFLDTVFPIAVAEQVSKALEFPDWLLETISSTTYSVFEPALVEFEHAVQQTVPHFYASVNGLVKEHAHPFASKLPLLNPWHVAFSVILYFVLMMAVGIVGKILGKHSYTPIGLVHNLFLHLLSLYMSVGIMVSARAAGFSLWNNASGTSEAEWRLAKLLWVFYASKIPEWMDTFLMLLKHNYRQVSFLHVYHHTTVFLIWWVANLKAPGGEAYYSAMVNSSVHVVMYGYYFFTIIFKTGPVRNILNRFKFFITKGQMIQFGFNCLQSIYDLLVVPRSELVFSADLLQLLFWYMISLLALFGNFLIKNSGGKKEHATHRGGSSAKSEKQEKPTHGTSPSPKSGATKAQLQQQQQQKDKKNGVKKNK